MENETLDYAEPPKKPDETPNQRRERERYEKNATMLYRVRNAVAQFRDVGNEADFLSAVRELAMAATGVLDEIATEQRADCDRSYNRPY